MSAPTFAEMKPRYAKLWADMKIQPKRLPEMKLVAALIFKNKARYLKVCNRLGISTDWWPLIGTIHYREADCSFKCHLHNGDPLTHRTVHVPKGRPPLPLEPPFTWEESAEDALRQRGIQHLGTFSVELFAYTTEGYNGWGYEMKGQTSGYDWSGTNDHAAGKFVRDHVYSRTAVDEQEGTMPLLYEIMLLDETVKAAVESPEKPQAPKAPEVVPAAEDSPAVNSVAPRVPLWRRVWRGLWSR